MPDMKLTTFWLIFTAAILLCGCTRGYKTVIGGESYAPVPIEKVAVLLQFPADETTYKVIGIVSSHGAALASDDAVYRKLQKSSADLGADAVVVGEAARNYRGTIGNASSNGTVYGQANSNGSYSGTYSGNTSYSSVPLYGLDVGGVAIKYVK
jgi:hypothetical protein